MIRIVTQPFDIGQECIVEKIEQHSSFDETLRLEIHVTIRTNKTGYIHNLYGLRLVKVIYNNYEYVKTNLYLANIDYNQYPAGQYNYDLIFIGMGGATYTETLTQRHERVHF